MKKAIGDNMIPKKWSFEQGLELVKRAGYDGIELWLGDVPWFQMETTDAQVSELRHRVENAGLVVSNVSTGLHWETPLSSRDPKVRAQAIRIVEREIEFVFTNVIGQGVQDLAAFLVPDIGLTLDQRERRLMTNFTAAPTEISIEFVAEVAMHEIAAVLVRHNLQG